MSLFQKPPVTPDEIERSKPLDIPPERVAEMDESEWYARAFRGDSAQLTVRAVAMGTVLGFFLAFTNVYVGLKTGWSLGVALTACILSFTVWTTLLKIGIAKSPLSILENNCMQSTASAAGYATSVITNTAVPAMLLLSVTELDPRGHNLPVYVVAPWVLCIAALGVVLAIPMKRSMINRERLKFPSGTAAAVLLQSLYTEGKEALAKGRALLIGGLAGVIVPLVTSLNARRVCDPSGKCVRDSLLPGQSKIFDVGIEWHQQVLDPKTHALADRVVRPSDWGIRLDHGVALVAAGAIVGLRTTIGMVLGGCITAFVLGPRALSWTWTNASDVVVAAAKGPGSAWKDIGIWYGAPMLVSYGLVSFALLQFKTIGRAVGSIGKSAGGAEAARAADVEVPLKWFVVGTAISGALIVGIAQVAFGIPVHYGALAVFIAYFLSLVACRATGETDITPGGPMGKIVQLTYGILMPQSYVANLMNTSITVGSSLGAADLLNDLKSGYLLGAHPRRQFVAQFLGIFTGTAATMIGYYVLVPDATKLTGTPDHPAAFDVPAALQWKAVAEVFKLGIGNLHPMARHGIAVGLAIGTVLAITEWALPKYKKWIPSPTGIGLGLLLNFFTSLSFLLGAIAGWIFELVNRKQAERFVVPISSGLIAGESIVGVVVAALNNFVLV